MSKQICHFLARNFGLKTNALHFELLPRALPIQILAKHKNKLFQLEALLFGTAGLLNERLLGDDYFLALRKEYSFLHKNYQLKPIESHLWKFLRRRPVNFPTVRLAQFAVLLHHSPALFSSLVELDNFLKSARCFAFSHQNTGTRITDLKSRRLNEPRRWPNRPFTTS